MGDASLVEECRYLHDGNGQNRVTVILFITPEQQIGLSDLRFAQTIKTKVTAHI